MMGRQQRALKLSVAQYAQLSWLAADTVSSTAGAPLDPSMKAPQPETVKAVSVRRALFAAHLEVVSAPDDAIKGHAVVGLLSTAELQEGKALVAVHVAAGDAGAGAQSWAHCSRFAVKQSGGLLLCMYRLGMRLSGPHCTPFEKPPSTHPSPGCSRGSLLPAELFL